MHDPAPDHDATQRAAFVSMRRRATGLFLGVTALFGAAHWFAPSAPWLRAVEAFAEAAMIGALADWFAVTALFRRPLGIPWHTEIIPRRKDAIGRNLGRFIQQNFLSRRILYEKMRAADPALSLASWLSRPESANAVAAEAALLIKEVLRLSRDEDVRRFVRESIARGGRLRLAPHVGTLVDTLLALGAHQRVLDQILPAIRAGLHEGKPAILARVRERSYWFVPSFVDRKVVEDLVSMLDEFLSEMLEDPRHELRDRLEQAMRSLAGRLRTDDAYRERAGQMLDALVAHPELVRYMDALWSTLKLRATRDLDDPASTLRTELGRLISTTSARLATDAPMRERVNHDLTRLVIHLSARYRDHVSGHIAERVSQWGASEITDKLELQVGADLQYIRINGTLIGGTAGLLLYALTLGMDYLR
jgi:uncharacterized membrane-anchored protein YjiN (DUF445 family)